MSSVPTMQAWLLESVDAPFQTTSVPRPEPAAGQVLVRIIASGVNPLDVKIRHGQAPHAKQPLPAVLGLDLAGVVECVGGGVTAFKAGDMVYGLTGGVGGLQGSLASFAAVDADLLALKPATLDMREAAALPLIFITAWEGLVDRGHVQAGQKVLVQGAGGVGQMVIQIARAHGAEVFAVDSAGKRPLIEAYSAIAIDRHQSTVEHYIQEHTGGHGFDLVYDTVGGPGLDASFQAVRRFGHVVSCLGWGTHGLAPLSFRAATYSGVFSLLPMLTGQGRAHHGDILRQAARLAEDGKIRPRLDPRRFGPSSILEAYGAIEGHNASGKIVIDVPH
ncbi:zinc-dependent alcohol dehydrogenase family protein [Bradyrhizobium retamae]|uniref:Quinone oxidoreductase n=1 Tax=Bradyrhizobium retamae TaxID=1300035 RepID=A0A0R3MQU3_9BRAD|nr:zinc-dependent alcohol dehydrogenase family protein [Bradyrhizobium retamae]KRR22568.1 quinone oxidoreductase [Bradyrhizobium retamae]